MILLTAAYLRWLNIGAEGIGTDGSILSLKAINVARRGVWETRGPAMSVGTWHSPFTVYVYALPYWLSPDVRMAYIFTGAMNLIAVSLVYLIGARYLHQNAGLVAALLYAVHPEALYISRQVLNTALGPPFAMLYVLTGLRGYYEDKKWSRVAHLPMLSLGGQCHPATFLLLPITVVLGAHARQRYSSHRRQILFHSIAGSALAVLLLLPWGIGLYQSMRGSGEATFEFLPNRGPAYLYDTLFILLGGWQRNYTQPIQPILIVVGATWLMARALRRDGGLPGLVAVLGFFLVPGLALLMDIKYRDTYIWPVYGNAFLIQGALIGGVRDEQRRLGPRQGSRRWRGLLHGRITRWVGLFVVASLVLMQLRFFATFDRSGGGLSLDDRIAALDMAAETARRLGRDLLLLFPYGDGVPNEYWQWELLIEGRDARIIWHGRGMPLPTEGAVLLGPAEYEGRPLVFSGGKIIQPGFRLAELPPAGRFVPDLPLVQPVQFSSGVTVLGFLREQPGSAPAPGKPWTAYMVWRVDAPRGEDIGVFVHVLDEAGNKYAQLDLIGLPAGQQRPAELVMNQLDFDFGEGLPREGPLYFLFGTVGPNGQASALDSAGNVVGGSGLVQVRGSARPTAQWADGLTLDRIATNSPLQQGSPLDVTATWLALERLPGLQFVTWRLLTSSGVAVYQATTDLLGSAPGLELPAGAFTTQQYRLRIPTGIEAGDYVLELSRTQGEADIGTPYRAPVSVTARERRFEAPPMEHRLTASFGDLLKLLGYDLRLEGRMLQIVLHWQAIGQIERDYKYFVHVWRDGQVVAQSDGMPAAYAYPTSWWAPDEVYSETVLLDLSALGAGRYTLTTGFYDPVSGERLPVEKGDGTAAAEWWVLLRDVMLK